MGSDLLDVVTLSLLRSDNDCTTVTEVVCPKGPALPRVVLAVLVVVAFGAGVAIDQMWWTMPAAFASEGVWFTAKPQGPPYEAMNMSVSDPRPHEAVSVDSVKPVIGHKTADSTIELVTCHSGGKSVVLADWGPLGECCTSTTPVAGHELDLGDDDQYVLMRITPRTAGVTKVDGITCSYRRGWRHLRQSGMQRVKIRAHFTLNP